ncbi:MAG: carboxylating nicotinate-nucleotide diphosphorylase [Gemmatimonadetes bacterium]|nr:carboxylating nicotinate-nucleotide diphosphorylase [Gemmatimonadota bacterium]
MNERLQTLIRAALREDRVDRDVTTLASVPAGHRSRARIIAKAAGVLSGTRAADAVFRLVDSSLTLAWEATDGDRVRPKDVVLRIEGSTSSILRAERVALNFLMRLSGIATEAARYVEATGASGTEILDTRKTTPGLRLLEKEAVRHGGGTNHRADLASMALLKENHLAAAGGILPAVAACRERFPGIPVEVEVVDFEGLQTAIESGADRIMLDNFTNEEIASAVERTRATGSRVYLEASGGFDLARVRAVAPLGVNGISIGALTHSVRSLDLSLLLEDAAI